MPWFSDDHRYAYGSSPNAIKNMIALTHSFHRKLSCFLNAHIVVVKIIKPTDIYIHCILMGVTKSGQFAKTNLAKISDMNLVVFCPSEITHYMVIRSQAWVGVVKANGFLKIGNHRNQVTQYGSN